VIGRRRTLLNGGTRRRRFAAHSGSLRVGEPGSGDQRNRCCRNHKAINHRISPHVFFIARADNERRCAMFPDIGGSIAFVL
jgi:hypothetical protein